MVAAFGANNHGSIIEINDKWYIFYHRHTNGTWYSRQVCAEELAVNKDGSFSQAHITSCGLNNGPLRGKGYYPAYIACNMFYPDWERSYTDINFATQPEVTRVKVTREESTGDAIIANFGDGAVIGFKYFDFKAVKKITIYVHGYCGGTIEVRTELDGPVVGSTEMHADNFWKPVEIDVTIPDGVHALYFTHRGNGNMLVKGFEIE